MTNLKYFWTANLGYTDRLMFKIQGYMLACTLQLLQVDRQIDILIERQANVQDTRVHACLYFIAPTGRQIDKYIDRKIG